MKKLLYFILIYIGILSSGVVLSQSKESHASKSPVEQVVARNKSDNNVLFAGDDFYVRNVYPNPADDHITIDYSVPSHLTTLKFEIRNILGNVVNPPYYLSPGSHRIVISTSNLDPGIYFHSLYLDNKNLVTRKLIIKR